MSIYLQNFMPIQPRTSLLKFGQLAAKSGKGTVLYLSTKVERAAARLDPARLPRRELREALRIARVVDPADDYWVACEAADS